MQCHVPDTTILSGFRVPRRDVICNKNQAYLDTSANGIWLIEPFPPYLVNLSELFDIDNVNPSANHFVETTAGGLETSFDVLNRAFLYIMSVLSDLEHLATRRGLYRLRLDAASYYLSCLWIIAHPSGDMENVPLADHVRVIAIWLWCFVCVDCLT